jgi:hypothetical protein
MSNKTTTRFSLDIYLKEEAQLTVRVYPIIMFHHRNEAKVMAGKGQMFK